MMELPGIIGLLLLLANIGIYLWHKKRNYRPITEQTQYYTVSIATRLFARVKYLLYLLLFIHITNSGLISPSPFQWWSVIAACILGTGSLVLLHTSLKILGENFAPCDLGIKPSVIIDHGPYSWCRHPIYLSNLLHVVAQGMIVNGPIAWCVFITLLVFYGFIVRDEERSMAQD